MISGGLFFFPSPYSEKGSEPTTIVPKCLQPLNMAVDAIWVITQSVLHAGVNLPMALAGCHVQWIHELGIEATERQLRHSNIRTAIFVDVLKQYGVAAVRLQKASSSTGALSDHQALIPLIFTLIQSIRRLQSTFQRINSTKRVSHPILNFKNAHLSMRSDPNDSYHRPSFYHLDPLHCSYDIQPNIL